MAANHMSEATQLEMLIKKVGPAAARQILQSQAEQQEQLVRQQEQQQLANRQQQQLTVGQPLNLAVAVL